MINLLLIGQADHDNFGDSLIFSMYCKMLESMGDYKIFIWRPSEIFVQRLKDDNVENFVIINEFNEIDIFHIDNVVLVPGGFLGCPDITDVFWQIKWNNNSYIKNIVENINLYNKKTMVHGVEFGPLLRPLVLPYIRKFLINTNIVKIYSRNNAGSEYIKRFINKEVEVLPDFVMGINSISGYVVSDKKNELGLHATGKIFSSNSIAKRFLFLIEKFIVSNNIKKILIFSDQLVGGEILTNIYGFIERLKLKNIYVDFINYSGHISTINCITSCKTLITSKLHVGVVGLSFGVKVISISSHPKLSRFYDDIGLGNFSINYFFSSSKKKLKLISLIYLMEENIYFKDIKYQSEIVSKVYKKTFLDFLNSKQS